MNWYLICTAVAAASAIAMAWFCGRARSAAAAAKFTAAEMRGERNDWQNEAQRLKKMADAPRVGDYSVRVWFVGGEWHYRITRYVHGHYGMSGPTPPLAGPQETGGPYSSQRAAIKEAHRRVGKMRARSHIGVAAAKSCALTETEAPA